MESKKESENAMVENSKGNGITLNDIIILKNLVNISARRGAFSVEEFKEIGEIYEKVDNFCKEQSKLLESSNETEESGKI